MNRMFVSGIEPMIDEGLSTKKIRHKNNLLKIEFLEIVIEKNRQGVLDSVETHRSNHDELGNGHVDSRTVHYTLHQIGARHFTHSGLEVAS